LAWLLHSPNHAIDPPLSPITGTGTLRQRHKQLVPPLLGVTFGAVDSDELPLGFPSGAFPCRPVSAKSSCLLLILSLSSPILVFPENLITCVAKSLAVSPHFVDPPRARANLQFQKRLLQFSESSSGALGAYGEPVGSTIRLPSSRMLRFQRRVSWLPGQSHRF